jgi:hypothetical protein
MAAVEANVDGLEDKIFNQSKYTVQNKTTMCHMHLLCAFLAKNPVMLYQCNSSVQCDSPEYFFIRLLLQCMHSWAMPE